MIQLYKSSDGWRWSAIGMNGEIVASSGEGFASRAMCCKNLRVLLCCLIDAAKCSTDGIESINHVIVEDAPTKQRRRKRKGKIVAADIMALVIFAAIMIVIVVLLSSGRC